MKVFCIFSDERAFRSRSPRMFTRVLQSQGIRGAYVPFRIRPEHLGQAIQSLRILNIEGANITVPYKEKVIPYLDILSEGANIIGAVNTIVRNGDQLKGYNTNAIGIMDALADAGFDAEGKSGLIFGTGGAARAAAFILSWLRTDQVFLYGRNPEKASAVASHFGGTVVSADRLRRSPLDVSIVVNATSVSSPDESAGLTALAWDLELPACELVLDLNYGHPENLWEELAGRQDIRFMDGLRPLAYQARRTFALWTRLQVPPETFIKAINGP